MKHKAYTVFILFFLLLMVSSCATVESWQMAYLNDEEMQLKRHGLGFEDYVHTIRTGTIKAGSAKSGGGCGCN